MLKDGGQTHHWDAKGQAERRKCPWWPRPGTRRQSQIVDRESSSATIPFQLSSPSRNLPNMYACNTTTELRAIEPLVTSLPGKKLTTATPQQTSSKRDLILALHLLDMQQRHNKHIPPNLKLLVATC
jgi:hypothetical protein